MQAVTGADSGFAKGGGGANFADQPYGAARWNALWHTAQHAKLKLGGSGGMPPRKFFKKWCQNMAI